TSNGCTKAEEFVSFCDAFNIPILTLVNVKGYSATKEEEKNVGKAAAKLTYAFAQASVPKVSLITKQAMGSAYITMNSKHIGADMVFALPDAKIGTMDSDLAVQIMYAEELKNADPSLKAEKAAEYEALCSNAESAAKRGYVDAVIESSMARQHIIYAFEMLYGKKESRPSKKHGTV
ncbi:MAG: carboxyl transferase, partial [Lachnospiraceae bacterium]|nr:carboxyl transferase [Lachnospiraceae bacterium]